MEDDALIHSVMQDIVLMKYVGIRPIIVHGGGPRITAWMDKIGKVPEFVQGLRVTDAETVEVAEMVLGSINKEIVSRINQHGGKAIGLSGKDANLVLAEKQETQVADENGQKVDADLGFVGKIIGINTEPVTALDKSGYIPVITRLVSVLMGRPITLMPIRWQARSLLHSKRRNSLFSQIRVVYSETSQMMIR